MSIFIFIIILSALIVVHELGHFLAAKWSGIRVDEFGLGFPPRAKKLFTWKGTPFTLNWLPFGGFVKIFGENPEEPIRSDLENSESKGSTLPAKDNFQSKNRGTQAAVLAAGVFFNFLFAWALISFGFMVGLPAPVGQEFPVENPVTTITLVDPASPAGEADLRSGDEIISLTRGMERLPLEGEELTPEAVSEFIGSSREQVIFEISRGGEILEKSVVPEDGIVEGRPAIGIAMDSVGIAKLSPHLALWHGLKTTWALTISTGYAIFDFLSGVFRGNADLSEVTGPVGIVGVVGDVSELGFMHLVTLTALISINLAVINLLPFPALDGGRLVFVAIEAITRRSVPAKIFNIVNTAGFLLLILLMLIITARDISNLF